jgi:hypothetical protein
VCAEELDHPIKGLYDSNKHDDKDKASFYPVQRLPFQEKEEEGDQGKPFEKFDLGGKGNKGYWRLRIADCGLNINKTELLAESVGFGGDNLQKPGGKGRDLEKDQKEEKAQEGYGYSELVVAEGIKLRTPLVLPHEELDCAEKKYGENAQLHEGESPELHGAKGNGCEDEKKSE